MTPLTTRTKSVLAIALLVPFMAALWLAVQPQFLSGSTYAMFAALVIATAAVALNAWKNGQATTSTSQLIHEAEVGPSTRAGTLKP